MNILVIISGASADSHLSRVFIYHYHQLFSQNVACRVEVKTKWANVEVVSLRVYLTLDDEVWTCSSEGGCAPDVSSISHTQSHPFTHLGKPFVLNGILWILYTRQRHITIKR